MGSDSLANGVRGAEEPGGPLMGSGGPGDLGEALQALCDPGLVAQHFAQLQRFDLEPGRVVVVTECSGRLPETTERMGDGVGVAEVPPPCQCLLMQRHRAATATAVVVAAPAGSAFARGG